MPTASLRSIRLTRFKSFHKAILPLGSLTILTGRNSSGKSNALDGIDVLARLAGGEELADGLDGRRREAGPVRGGSRGCVPHGSTSFEIGCTVAYGRDTYSLDVVIQVEPELRITYERLQGPAPALESGNSDVRDLIITKSPQKGAAFIEAEVYNGKRGHNPTVSFRDTRLLTSQLSARLAPQNKADRAVLRGAQAITAALRGAFHLDPVPHLMREYVPERDADLRRTGQNLSAAIGRLQNEDRATFERLEELVRIIAGEPVRGLAVTTSSLGDVMLALRERDGQELTPAREMSDGLLRFLAIATALLTANRGLDIDPGFVVETDLEASVLMVLEELENGLHSSQAGRVLKLISETSDQLGTQTLLTTHSPALLNALSGQQTRDVVVCFRDDQTGTSRLSRLYELPGYASLMASGRLGDVVTRGDLTAPNDHDTDYSALDQLLGIDE